MTLRDCVLDRTAEFLKRYLREFVSEIRFNGERVVMRDKKVALLAAVAQKKWAQLVCPALPLIGSSTWARTRDLRINRGIKPLFINDLCSPLLVTFCQAL